MSDRNSHDIKDVKWESIDSNEGEIRFRKRRGVTKIHSFAKGIFIIVVAIVSGVVGGEYLVDRRNLEDNLNKKQVLQARSSSVKTVESSLKSNDKEEDNEISSENIANKISLFLGIRGGMVCSQSNRIQGFYISEVEKGRSAAVAGMKPTDILVQIDNISIKKYDDLLEVMNNHKIGDSVKCKIWRSGKTEQINIVFIENKDIGNK